MMVVRQITLASSLVALSGIFQHDELIVVVGADNVVCSSE